MIPMLRRSPPPQMDVSDESVDAMLDLAHTAAEFLKAISHEGRLMILCHLATGEKSVTELEDLLSARQAAVSQQLSRLRLEGLDTDARSCLRSVLQATVIHASRPCQRQTEEHHARRHP